MRRGVRHMLVTVVLVLAGVASASALLRQRAATAARTLARAATTRHVTAPFMPSPRQPTVIARMSFRQNPTSATAGFGPGTTWYSADRTSGNVIVGDISTVNTLAAAATGSGRLGPLSADPVESDGVIFVPTETQGLIALDLRTLAPVWTDATLRSIDGLAVADGRLYVAERNAVRALDAATGRLIWSRPATAVSTGVAAAAGDRICFGTGGDAVFHVLRASDGRELHAVRLERPAAGSIAVAGDTAFVLAAPLGGASVLPLYAIDLAHGRVLWHDDVPAETPLGVPRASGPVAGEGVVCFSFEDWFYAVDAATGHQRWRYQPAHDDDFNLWRRSSQFDPLVSNATIRDGVAYVAAPDRFLGVSLATGREVWRYQPPYSANWGRLSYVPPRVRGNLVLGVIGQSLHQAAPLDPQPVTPASLIRPARSGAVGWTGVAGLVGVGIVVATVVATTRRWRAAVALICLALTPLVAWSWATSYAARQFVGQQRLTVAGAQAEWVRRGIHTADGAVTIGATHEVWQRTLKAALPGGPGALLAWSDEPLDSAALVIHETPPDTGLLSFGVTWHSGPSGTALGDQSERAITLPHWFLLLALAVPQLAWLTGRWRDRRKYPPGHCRGCGYDLRESAGRCPECGEAVAVG